MSLASPPPVVGNPPPQHQVLQALLAQDRAALQAWLQPAPSQAETARAIEQWLMPALEQIGAGWERGDYSLAQVYLCGRLCETLVDEWLPLPAHETAPARLALAVLDDYHLLGARLVYSVLRTGGLPVRAYGRQTVEGLVQRVQQDGIQVLLVSTLMLPAALRVRELRRQLTQAGLSVKLVVGGAPFRFDEALWREVGADAMGRTASDALALSHHLLEASQ